MTLTDLILLYVLFFSIGSFVEFIKIVPMLTQINDPDQDFVFEVIAPSIPGTIIKMVIFTLQCCQIQQFVNAVALKFNQKI